MEDACQFWPNFSSNPQRNSPQLFVTCLHETMYIWNTVIIADCVLRIALEKIICDPTLLLSV